jgi:hypothetical protein
MRRVLTLLISVCLNLHPAPGAAQNVPSNTVPFGGDCSDKPGRTDPAYPYDVARVAWAFRRAPADESSSRVKVLVVDNGFVGYRMVDAKIDDSPNFPRLFFYNQPGQDYRPFSSQIDLDADDDSKPWIKGHGTHITGLILGGGYGSGNPSRTDVGKPEVRRLFLLDPPGGSSPEAMPPRDWMQIYVFGLATDGRSYNAEALETLPSNLINKAPPKAQRPDIVNMSLLYTPNTDEVPETIRTLPGQFKDALVIVSAGNGYVRLHAGTNGQYPAMSDDPDGNLIVVGAHDASLRRPDFSNHHPDHVTLAAPGCLIRSWISGEGDPKAYNGTSQAAAIVSFGAALLKSRWTEALPKELRERLIASSRYSEAQASGCFVESDRGAKSKEACVRHGSVLDIEMALFYDTDAIEYCKDESAVPGACETQIILGKITAVPEAFLCGEDRARSGNTGLTKSTGIRFIRDHEFQVIYRRLRPSQPNETLTADGCEHVRATDDVFTIKREGIQPGDVDRPSEPVQIPVRSIVRVVTRSF